MQATDWMRDKKTGKFVQIKGVGLLVEYVRSNGDSAFIQPDRLAEEFDLLGDLKDRDNVESLLRGLIRAGEAETGLYDIGGSYIAVDLVYEGGKDVVTFQWFDSTIPICQLLNQ